MSLEVMKLSLTSGYILEIMHKDGFGGGAGLCAPFYPWGREGVAN